MLLFTTQYPTAGESEVTEFENIIGRSLPGDYRDFLLNVNGGTPVDAEQLQCAVTWEEQPREDSIDATGIKTIYTLDRDNYEHSLEEKFSHYYLEEQLIPVGTIPIANDQEGNQYLLDLTDEGYGIVHFWLADVSESYYPDRFEGGYLGFVADSFSEFLHLFSTSQ